LTIVQTIPKFRRIKSGEEFRRVLATYFGSNKWFVGYVHENGMGVSRLGIIVSKRVAPDSVDRNYAKRLIREGFRREFPAKCALDIVIRLRCPLNRETSGEGRKALTQLLGNIQKRCVSS
jgi:ribonuclease P protein component